MSKKMEEKVDYSTQDFEVDDSPIEIVPVEKPVSEYKPEPSTKKTREERQEPIINVLRNERITVRHIPKEGGMVTNPKHILYGGMAEGASRTFVVPRLRSGSFVNVLTNNEKAYLEDAMGLEYNALSALKTKGKNYWEDVSVRLTKQDNYLDLSSPEDYIKYKVLLANKDFIAPSLQALQDEPKATYQFVIISEGEENKQARDNMSSKMKCYMEYGKIENDVYTLRVIIESIDGRATAPNSKLEFLQGKINDLIQADSKLFLRVITDPYLSTKVLIKKAVEAGVISNRDNHYYIREDNTPLCEANEEATLSYAAKYLNSSKHQDVLFAIQAKVKE